MNLEPCPGKEGPAMSMFEDGHYRWRETYFVLFESGRRPTLKAVAKTLSGLDAHYELLNLSADEEGRFDSLTLVSPEDFAALDICYTSGEEVLEHRASLAKELRPTATRPAELAALGQLKHCDARFDVLHFEQVSDHLDDEDEPDEVLDPGALILVLGALARITGGVAIDPQSGTILLDED